MYVIHVKIFPLLKDNYSYLIEESVQQKRMIIDPSDALPIISYLQEQKLSVDYIFNTHHHWDHTNGNKILKEYTGAQLIVPEKEKNFIEGFDQTVNEETSFFLGKEELTFIEVPGHTKGHMALLCPDSHLLFSGDSLFSMGCGRLFEGNAEEMWLSLKKLRALPDVTHLYPGHEYTLKNLEFAMAMELKNQELKEYYHYIRILREKNLFSIPSSLKTEKKLNPFLRCDEIKFVEQYFPLGSLPEDFFAFLRMKKNSF